MFKSTALGCRDGNLKPAVHLSLIYMFSKFLVIFLALQFAPQLCAASEPFHPGEYAKNTATCKALKRADNVAVDIQMRTYRFPHHAS